MGGAAKIPDELRRFIVTSIESIPFLEALLQCFNAPEQSWNSVQLAQRLFIPPTAASVLLKKLSASGFIKEMQGTGSYRYDPETAGLHGLTQQLAQFYGTNLVEITHLVHSKAHGAQKFADAFKFGRQR